MHDRDETLAALLSPQAGGEAWTDFFQRHQATVFRTCYGVLRRRDLAEDAAQETFLTVLERRQGLQPERNVRGWLHRVAVNAALQVMRSERRRHRRDRAAGLERCGGSGAQPDGDALAAADRPVVRRHVESLPARWRLPVLLRHEEGLSYAEIAAALGIPEGTVASRLNEGLARLRASLGASGLALAIVDVERAIGLLPPHPVPDSLIAALDGMARGSASSAPAGAPTAGLPPSGLAPSPAGAKAVAVAMLLAAILGVGFGISRSREWGLPAARPRAELRPGTPGTASPSPLAGSGIEVVPVASEPGTAIVAADPARVADPAGAAQPEAFVFRGRIVDERTGMPVRNAAIRWTCGENIRRILSRTTVSGSDGRFRLEDLPSEKGILFAVVAEDYAERSFSIPDDSVREERDHALEPGWQAVLRLRDPSGTPVDRGLSFRIDPDGKGWRMWERLRHETTGEFRFEGLSPSLQSPSVCRIQVQHAERRPVIVDGWDVRLNPSTRRAEVEVILDSGGQIRGFLRSPSGLRLAGAVVSAWRADREDPLSMRQVTADEQGRYRLAGLTAGPWCLHVRGAGCVLGEAARVDVEEGADIDLPLEVPLGGVIEGVLVDERGEPLPGVGIGPIVQEGYPGPGSGVFRGLVNTNAQGRFRTDGLPLDLVYRIRCDSHALRLDSLRATPEGFEVRLTGWRRDPWDPSSVREAMTELPLAEGIRFR